MSDDEVTNADTGQRSPIAPYASVPLWVFDRLLGRSKSALQLYVLLAATCDYRTHRVIRRRAWLAERMQCSPDTVDRALKELMAAGVVTRQRRMAEGTDQNLASEYRLRSGADPDAVAEELRGEGGRSSAARSPQFRGEGGRSSAARSPQFRGEGGRRDAALINQPPLDQTSSSQKKNSDVRFGENDDLPPDQLREFEPELADSDQSATESAVASAAIRADWRPAGADAPVALDLGDRRDRAAAVFRCWVLVHEKRGNVRLNDKRRKLINRAIKEYGDGNLDDGVVTCLDAIRGSLADPYYRETGSAFADPEHILRIGGRAETRNNVEYFAGLWAEHGARYLETGRWPSAPSARAVVRHGPEPLTETEATDLADERLVDALRDQTDQRRASTVTLRVVWGEILARVETGDALTCRKFLTTLRGIKFKPADPALEAVRDVRARCKRRLADLGEPAPSRAAFPSPALPSGVPTFEEIYNQQVAAGLVRPDGALRLDLVTLPIQDPKPRELSA